GGEGPRVAGGRGGDLRAGAGRELAVRLPGRPRVGDRRRPGRPPGRARTRHARPGRLPKAGRADGGGAPLAPQRRSGGPVLARFAGKSAFKRSSAYRFAGKPAASQDRGTPPARARPPAPRSPGEKVAPPGTRRAPPPGSPPGATARNRARTWSARGRSRPIGSGPGRTARRPAAVTRRAPAPTARACP